MQYREKQELIIKDFEARIKAGEFADSTPPMLANYILDPRLALSFLYFLPQELQERVMTKLVTPLMLADSRQYAYIPESLHATVLGIHEVTDPPNYTPQDIEKATEVLREVIPKHQPIQLHLRGILELPTSLALVAYADDDFHQLVHDLRQSMRQHGVAKSKRHISDSVFFSNVTVCRYTCPPNDAFQKLAHELKHIDLGSFVMDKVALIESNAACHPSKTKVVAEASFSA